MVGDNLAVASKKMIGVASAAVSAYVQTIFMNATLVASGIGYVAQGLELVGVHGTVIDGMKAASSAMTSMISLLWAPLDCITAWSAGGENTAIFAAQNAIGTAIVTAMAAGAAKPQEMVSATQSTFQKLTAQATALAAKAAEKAAPAVQGAQAIIAAKKVYDAAAEGNIGWESSAYDAWASQNSVSVYTTCMANRAGTTVDNLERAMP